MLAEPLHMEGLESLTACLAEQLEAAERLHEAMERLSQLAEKDEVPPEALEEALTWHAEQLAAAREAERRFQEQRLAWQELTGSTSWSLGEMDRILQRKVADFSSSPEHVQLEKIRRMAGELHRMTEELQAKTVGLAGLLSDRLRRVAGEIQSLRRGRQASNAYAAGQEHSEARFIDRQE